jgi:cytoplasmic FMR1 interacting protein
MFISTAEDQSAEIAMQHMDQQYAPLHLVSMVSKYGTQQQIDNAKDSDLLTKERLCRALSMFEVVMQRIKAILLKNELVRTVCVCMNE